MRLMIYILMALMTSGCGDILSKKDNSSPDNVVNTNENNAMYVEANDNHGRTWFQFSTQGVHCTGQRYSTISRCYWR